jgi:formate dehydrogenase subunit gamma
MTINSPLLDASLAMLEELPRTPDSLLPALIGVQRALGYVPDEAIQAIALHVRSTANVVEGVATAYPEIARTAPSRHVVRVCTGVSCRCRGASDVLIAARDVALSSGEMHVEEAPCLFSCAVAPVIEVDGAQHGRLDAAAARSFLTQVAKEQES